MFNNVMGKLVSYMYFWKRNQDNFRDKDKDILGKGNQKIGGTKSIRRVIGIFL